MTDNEIARALGRIEGKVEAIQAQLTAGATRMDNYSGRLRRLEGWQKFVLGISAAVAAVVSFLMDFWRA
jgi:hypothetical protein